MFHKNLKSEIDGYRNGACLEEQLEHDDTTVDLRLVLTTAEPSNQLSGKNKAHYKTWQHVKISGKLFYVYSHTDFAEVNKKAG